MVPNISVFLLLVLGAAWNNATINDEEPEIDHRVMDEEEFEMTPQNERFFFFNKVLSNIAIPCRTRANCCRAQCTATTFNCVAGAAAAAVCMPAAGGAAVAGTECRTVQFCGACDIFNCNVNTACNGNTGTVCAIP